MRSGVVFCHTILHSILRSCAFPHNLASFLFLRPLQLPYFARESLRFQFSGFTMTGGLFFSSLPFSLNGILCISAKSITLLQTLAPWIGMWTHLWPLCHLLLLYWKCDLSIWYYITFTSSTNVHHHNMQHRRADNLIMPRHVYRDGVGPGFNLEAGWVECSLSPSFKSLRPSRVEVDWRSMPRFLAFRIHHHTTHSFNRPFTKFRSCFQL